MKQLHKHFKIRNLGEPKLFLGMEIHYFREQSICTLSQKHYIDKIARSCGEKQGSPPTTPMVHDIYKRLEETQQYSLYECAYKHFVGALIFLMVCTRAYIAYALSILAQAFSAPK